MTALLRARQRHTKARAAMLRLHAVFNVQPITLADCRVKGLVEEFDRARNNGLIEARGGNGDGTKSYALTQRAHDYLARCRNL